VLYGVITYASVTATVGANLVTYVSPTYIRVMPMQDGWNSYFRYGVNTNNQDYGLISAAKDGTLTNPGSAGPTTNFNTDIVFSDGQFTVYPEGVQQ
jgi:hypothetical protein